MDLIVKVTPTGPRASVSRLLNIPLELDVWEVKADYVVLRAAEAQVERLRQMGYGVEQLQETASFVSRFATPETVAGYHSAETLEQDLRQLAERQPEIAALCEIGRSVEGRPIWALRLGERRSSTRKLLFMGCHHAREWIAVEVPYLVAQYLVQESGSSPVQDWLSEGEIWVAPMVNSDGHEFSRTNERLWRKNRRCNADGSIGVDPNRNYGYMWGTLDTFTSSHTPSDNTYVGPRPFSEPETQAIRDLLGRERFRGVISFHSYSQLILYPWGFTEELIFPEDVDHPVRLAGRMQELIQDVHGAFYRPQQSSVLSLSYGGGHNRLDIRDLRDPFVHHRVTPQ